MAILPKKPTTPTTPKPPTMGIGGNPAGSQASHQAWINDPRSGQGGMEQYVKNQQTNYDNALAKGDTAFLERLKADQARVGYSLKPSTVGQATTPTTSPTTDYINQMRDLAANNLQQQAYDARNQADVVNMQNARGLQEIMSNRGLGASGENITAVLNQNAQRQGALTDINNQLSQDLNELDINRANQLMQQYNIDQDRAIQLAQMMGNYNGQRTLQGQQFDRGVLESDRAFDWGKAMDLAGLTGSYNGQRTLQGQQFDFGKSMDIAGLTGMYGGQRTLAGQEFDYNKASDLRDYNRGVLESDRNYNLDMSRESRIASGGGSSGGSSDFKPPNQNTIIDNVLNMMNRKDADGNYLPVNQDALIRYIASQYPDDPKYDDEIEVIVNALNLKQGGSSSGALAPLYPPVR